MKGKNHLIAAMLLMVMVITLAGCAQTTGQESGAPATSGTGDGAGSTVGSVPVPASEPEPEAPVLDEDYLRVPLSNGELDRVDWNTINLTEEQQEGLLTLTRRAVEGFATGLFSNADTAVFSEKEWLYTEIPRSARFPDSIQWYDIDLHTGTPRRANVWLGSEVFLSTIINLEETDEAGAYLYIEQAYFTEVGWGVEQLTMLARVEDIPTEYHRYSLNDREVYRDGTPWLATPGSGLSGWKEQPIFVDRRFLYIRAEWEEDGSYQWYYFGTLDVPGSEDYGVIPDSQETMFTGVDGTHLVCEDGRAFDTVAWEWTVL